MAVVAPFLADPTGAKIAKKYDSGNSAFTGDERMTNCGSKEENVTTTTFDPKAPRTVDSKKTFTISGTLKEEGAPQSQKPVTLCGSTDGVSYSVDKVNKCTTDEKGDYTFSARQLAAGTYYKVCYDGVLSDDIPVETVVTWGPGHSAVVIVCLAVLVGLPIALAGFAAAGTLVVGLAQMYEIWTIILAFIVILILVAGHGLTGRASGLLIDERNRMSASRLQIIIWTLVIVPALLAFIYINIGHGSPNAALSVAIPPELWALPGISGGAAIGAPVANDVTNRNKPVSEDAAKRANTTVTALDHEGVLDVNTTAAGASLADVLQGDEIGNRGSLDISKVQMLLISIGLALGYGAAIAILLAQAAHATPPAFPLSSFPAVDPNLTTLLLVSQGTYFGVQSGPAYQRLISKRTLRQLNSQPSLIWDEESGSVSAGRVL
jgi:hypothetical protein